MGNVSSGAKHRVLIVGGGVAALEAALALRQLAPDHTTRAVIAPNDDYVVRPQTVREPFSYPAAERHPIAPIVQAAGADLIVDALDRVDVETATVHTKGGLVRTYDSLVLAIGARTVDRYEHGITVDHRNLASALSDLLGDIDAGVVRSIAFVVPGILVWPLPIYELALMTAQRASDAGKKLDVTLISPEDRPLALFGMQASRGVARLLHERGVELEMSADAEIPHGRQVVLNPGERRLHVDAVVTMPELVGPALPGVPCDAHGFIPVDEHGRVVGAPGVYAAGDAVAYPTKQGGVSAQQADAVCEHIAQVAGEAIEPAPFEAMLRGTLLTGAAPVFLSARVSGGHAFDSLIGDEPLWNPPSKISARYLSPYLELRNAERAAASAGQ